MKIPIFFVLFLILGQPVHQSTAQTVADTNVDTQDKIRASDQRLKNNDVDAVRTADSQKLKPVFKRWRAFRFEEAGFELEVPKSWAWTRDDSLSPISEDIDWLIARQSNSTRQGEPNEHQIEVLISKTPNQILHGFSEHGKEARSTRVTGDAWQGKLWRINCAAQINSEKICQALELHTKYRSIFISTSQPSRSFFRRVVKSLRVDTSTSSVRDELREKTAKCISRGENGEENSKQDSEDELSMILPFAEDVAILASENCPKTVRGKENRKTLDFIQPGAEQEHDILGKGALDPDRNFSGENKKARDLVSLSLSKTRKT